MNRIKKKILKSWGQLCDSNYMRYESSNPWGQKEWQFRGPEGLGNYYLVGAEFQFCNMKRGVEIMEVTVQQFELSTATRWTVLLKMGKMVNFVMCILSKFFK